MAHLFQAARENVVAGLEWRGLGNDGLTPAQDRRQTAKTLNARFGVDWETAAGRRLVGLVLPGSPAGAQRAVSAAAWLALAANEKVIYVDEIQPGRYWLLVAGAGAIDTRGDRILSVEDLERSLTDLLDEAKQHEDEQPFKLVFASELGLNIPMLSRVRPARATFAELVKHLPPSARMRPRQLVGIPPGVWVAIAAVLVLGAGLVGLWRYFVWVEEQAEIAERAARAQRERETRQRIATMTDARMVEAVSRELASDTQTPEPTVLLEQCLNVYARVGAVPAGWRVSTIECQGGPGAMVALEKPSAGAGGVGTNLTLWRWADAELSVAPALAADARRAQLSVAGAAVDPRPAMKLLDLPRNAEAMLSLGTRFQMVELASPAFRFVITDPVPKKILFVDPAKETTSSGVDAMSEVPPERSYRRGTWTLQGASLFELEDLALDWPWITVSKIQLRPSDSGLDWTLEGAYVHGNG